MEDIDPSNVFIALLHHPVYNKVKEVVTTSVTNLDIHDIARVSATFALGGYYVVNPMKAQRDLVNRITHHWLKGHGLTYNPNRAEAIDILKVVAELGEAVDDIEAKKGERPRLIATAAREFEGSIGYDTLKGMLAEGGPYLLMFGTGWGLTDEFVASADHVLKPVYGMRGYNHLPVRSAVSIILDRLLSNRA